MTRKAQLLQGRNDKKTTHMAQVEKAHAKGESEKSKKRNISTKPKGCRAIWRPLVWGVLFFCGTVICCVLFCGTVIFGVLFFCGTVILTN